jgi:hypothetical protein
VDRRLSERAKHGFDKVCRERDRRRYECAEKEHCETSRSLGPFYGHGGALAAARAACRRSISSGFPIVTAALAIHSAIPKQLRGRGWWRRGRSTDTLAFGSLAFFPCREFLRATICRFDLMEFTLLILLVRGGALLLKFSFARCDEWVPAFRTGLLRAGIFEGSEQGFPAGFTREGNSPFPKEFVLNRVVQIAAPEMGRGYGGIVAHEKALVKWGLGSSLRHGPSVVPIGVGRLVRPWKPRLRRGGAGLGDGGRCTPRLAMGSQ